MGNNDSNGRLDQFDRAILLHLGMDGRMAITDLASRVGLSKSPCQVRVKRLQDDGYIQGFRAVLDPVKLGLDHIAFAEVKLRDTTEAALSAFNTAVLKVPEIEECYMIAGAFDYLLKVRTRDIRAYRQVLGETISALPHVGSTSTHVSMQAVKDDAF
jgi:Lrp/AsnC family leucine-responsive transcriptional regulator